MTEQSGGAGAYNVLMSADRQKLDGLLEKARQLPTTPGVYLMKDADEKVIYVGKAASLRSRVSSYFLPSADLGPGKQPMLEAVRDFDTLDCEGEWEALLTENRLIKDIHPRFNVRMTDDKTFPYLVVTVKEDFPGVYITRQPNAPEYRGARVLGPFTSTTALRESIQLLQRVFKFRTCHLNIQDDDPERRHFRACLLYPIKKCTAPCAAKISKQAYREDIDRFLRFLDSKRSLMLRQLREEMQQASDARHYERAATLRDQVQAIEKLDERGKRSHNWQPETEVFHSDPQKGLESLRRTLGLDEPIRTIDCIDIAHLHGNETVGSKVCFIDGKPLKNAYRRYRIQSVEHGNDDYQAIREVVLRRYRDAGEGHELYPDLIVIDGGLGQLHAAREAFDELTVQPPKVIALAKKQELIYTEERSQPIKLARNNLGLKMCQAIRDEAHRFAQHYHHILRRKRTLGQE